MAAKCSVVTAFRNTLGLPGRLSVRLQPNHPTDDARGIAASILDGLLLGSGDAVIGINPATDSPTARMRCSSMLDEIRDQTRHPHAKLRAGACHHDARSDRQGRAGRSGVPIDRRHRGGQQELRHRSRLAREARDAALSLRRGTVGDNVMYFETGQGSALSANAHHGVDQQTLEARAYAVARAFKPLLVNTVVGFIGPEYLFNGKQIMRAGLEDHFCGKLLGVPMGVDVCYTNHADADQDDMDALLALLVAAGVNFVMGVPGADDIMLGYQSTSFHDALAMRDLFGRRPAPEFEAWLGAARPDRWRRPHSPAQLAEPLPRAACATSRDAGTGFRQSSWRLRTNSGPACAGDGGAHRAQARWRFAGNRATPRFQACARPRPRCRDEPLDEARLAAELAGLAPGHFRGQRGRRTGRLICSAPISAVALQRARKRHWRLTKAITMSCSWSPTDYRLAPLHCMPAGFVPDGCQRCAPKVG